MTPYLNNPVYAALSTTDVSFNIGNEAVKFFHPEVSPFAGFDEETKNGFEQLYDLFPLGRKILYAIPSPISAPKGWEVQHEIEGKQFVYEGGTVNGTFPDIVPLRATHVEEMIALTRLTKPGPFDKRTIEFGQYHGIFENGKLAAMTGQRLHINNFTEISAVCTHPDHLGKGYATSLLQHQLQIILNNGETPFLHVRADNERAIAVYERLGFKVSRPMFFYFMKRL
ncbi:MAG: GNAT family N-acetyltransferase [Lacibacter sp.]|jgi:ribosomal protein S18 acetylase RimI-like enzyme